MGTEEYNGIQKAAILLIALGPEKSASIFKHLKEDEIEELTLEIANTRSVSPQTKERRIKRILSGMPCTAVYCRRRYWLCQRAPG